MKSKQLSYLTYTLKLVTVNSCLLCCWKFYKNVCILIQTHTVNTELQVECIKLLGYLFTMHLHTYRCCIPFFFKVFFNVDLFYKLLIEFVIILLLSYVLGFGFRACGILAPGPRIETSISCIGRQSLNPWTAREGPAFLFYFCHF